jgi:membrane complex biogenesis BtpA family protein
MKRTSRLTRIFATEKPIIGMVHLRPLPGSPGYRHERGMKAIVEAGMEDASRLIEGGVDGIQIENQGDWPFLPPGEIGPETVAAVSAVVARIRDRFDVPTGINIHLNGVCQALAIAVATECRWVRAFELANEYISPSGIVDAAGPRALRFRSYLQAEGKVSIFGNYHVKHGSHQLVADKSPVELARDVEASLADALIITGRETGSAPDPSEIAAIREAVSIPLIIGSGLSLDTMEELLPMADGAIVGSAFKADGTLNNPVDIQMVREFMRAARALRRT